MHFKYIHTYCLLNKIKIVSANANGGGSSNVIPNSINGELAPALPDGGEAPCRIHTYRYKSCF